MALVIENAVEYRVFDTSGPRFGDQSYLPCDINPMSMQSAVNPGLNTITSTSTSQRLTTESDATGAMVKKRTCCRQCQLPISERFYFKVDEESWHETCLQCSVCQVKLERSCFVRNRQLFCRDDYYRLFLPKCADCNETVMVGEYAIRALDSVFHLRCFCCSVCRQPLRQGDLFVLPSDTRKPICKADYERRLLVNQSPCGTDSGYGALLYPNANPLVDPDLDPDSVDGYAYYRSHQTGPNSVLDSESELAPDGSHHRSMGGGAMSSGGKRPRTILTMTQRRKFKQAFEINPKPSRKIRESLAADTGLTVRVVQVWFQNQRAKVKKLARRHALLGKPTAGDSNGNHKKATSKTSDDQSCEAPVNTSFETLAESNSNEADDCSDDETVASSNCINNNSASSDNSHVFPTERCPSQSSGTTKTVNPIDQLYSIQNKYFG